MSMPSPAPAPTPASPAPTPPPAEFKGPQSQDELDRIIEGRLARERDKYKDYDELKTAKSEYDKYLESQKSDNDKALEEARKEAGSEVTQKFLTKLVNSEVKSIAATLGFNDPADALQVLGGDLPVKDDEPDADEIKKRVEKLATDKPYLVAAETRKPRSRPTPKPGEPVEPSTATPGKGKAAAALRQLGASRRTA